ncbi:MAG: SH3 domain-containing protein [Chloroflexi bacterium]|nr:SH3 domain-containing protein [Chloroflexota bacterium]
MKRAIIVLICLIGFSPVLAQGDTCPALIQSIFERVKTECAVIGRNQACYGNTTLQAEPQAGVADFAFSQPGDFVSVAGLQTLRAAPLNAATSEWGVALMKVQANIPDTLPGQGVTFVLFGNTEVENVVPFTSAGVEVTPNADSVLRGTPATDSAIVGAITTGQPAIAINRSTDDAWVRVELQGPGSRAGWLPASLLPASDWNTLPVFDPAAVALPGPMQAFRLKTTPLGEQCVDAPPDGLLVQTPQGDIHVELTINDVRIQLGSTVFIQAQPNAMMTLSVLEGRAQVTALGQTADVPQGMQVSVPMDDDLQPAAPPGTVVPYDAGAFSRLPVVLLPDPITVAHVDWAAGQSLCVTRADGAWLRAAPSSSSADIVQVLANGDAVAANGEPQYDGVQSWWPVRTGDSRTGWIEQVSLAACDRPVVPPCTPRTDWPFTYTVQSGDSLSKIAVAVGSSTAELSRANCIADPSRLFAGQTIRVPRQVVIVSSQPATTSLVVSGTWDFTIFPQICRRQGNVQNLSLNVSVSADGSAITVTAPDGSNLTFARVSDSVYQTTVSSNSATATTAQVQSQTTTYTVTVIGVSNGRTQARLDIVSDCPPRTGQSSQ